VTLTLRAVISVLLVVPIWIAAIAKIATLRQGRDRPRVLFLVSLIALGLAMTADREGPYVGLSRLLGVHNAGFWIAYSLSLVTSWAGTTLLLETWDPQRARRQRWWRLGAAWVAAAAFAITFFSGPAQQPTATVIQHSRPADLGTVGFRLLTGIVLTVVLTEVGYLCWRIASKTGDGAEASRWGLRLVTLGCVLTNVRLLGEQVFFTLGYVAGMPVPGPESLSLWSLNALAMAGAALIGAGPALPAVGRAWDRIGAWRHARVLLRDLEPLAQTLAPVTPKWGETIARAPVLRWTGAEDRLYGRVVGLRDAYLVLHPYRSSAWESAMAARQRERNPDAYHPAAVEAVGLLYALQRHAAGVDCAEPPATVGVTAASIGEEARHLAEVARWMKRYSRTGSASIDGADVDEVTV
jgi:hypothetical protein